MQNGNDKIAAWGMLLGGIMLGFAVLVGFLWDNQIAGARGLAAILAAVSSSLFALGAVADKRRNHSCAKGRQRD